MSSEVLKAYSHSTSELVRDMLQCNFTSYEKSWKVLRVDTPCHKRKLGHIVGCLLEDITTGP